LFTASCARQPYVACAALILNAVIHHVLDAEKPYDAVARYKQLLAPGSYLLLTHFSNFSEEARGLEQVLLRTLGRGQLRSREEITRFFDGFDLVPPGIVHLPEWQPDEPVKYPLDISELLYLGGLARKRDGGYPDERGRDPGKPVRAAPDAEADPGLAVRLMQPARGHPPADPDVPGGPDQTGPARHPHLHRTGVKRFHHPVVGDLTLTFEALDLAADEGLRISAYSAEPGTPSDDALKVLASWAATPDQAGQLAASADSPPGE
jgi:hypothetical protein